MTKLAKYEQQDQLTESGGFSKCYKGLWDKNTLVVLKKPDLKEETGLLEDELLSLCRGEIEIHTALDHPNIVKVIASDFVPGKLSECFLIMVWCNMGDLCTTLNRAATGAIELPMSTRDSIMKDMADAIDYLHQRKIIHRDIKPDNILLQYNNGKIQPQLSDFGFAKELPINSMPGFFDDTIFGTPPYIAPEIHSKLYYSLASDIFALGTVFYVITTLSLPDKVMELPETLPFELRDLIQKCAEPDRNKRPLISTVLACGLFKTERKVETRPTLVLEPEPDLESTSDLELDEPVPSAGWCCIFN